MQKLTSLAFAVMLALVAIGCGSKDGVPEGEGMESVLKGAGVDPKVESKNPGMPKAESPPNSGG